MTVVDYLESLDLLHERIEVEAEELPPCLPPPVKYVCDVGRGGHLSIFLPYLLRQPYDYVQWPTQPWYEERKSFSASKQYRCPLGRRAVPVCDEPQFGTGPRFFLVGRQFLDEKDLLHQLVPELMPPTFYSLQDAKDYADRQDGSPMLWFLKKVNQNGGRAVDVRSALPDAPLAADEQLQAHIPRPLLWEGTHKCHVKTYYYLSACRGGAEDAVKWHLYLHDLYYLATANEPWNAEDPSDDCQITTLRTHRLYADHPWRERHDLTRRCEAHLRTAVSRAIRRGKLRVPPAAAEVRDVGASPTLQFEINSADWMLSEDGTIYLIECNGIPVLYDGRQRQKLCTRGLKLYDRLYREDPSGAVVNDHELLTDALSLAMTGIARAESLWKPIATFPAEEGC